jgi:thiamine transport system substrate-binding protein
MTPSPHPRPRTAARSLGLAVATVALVAAACSSSTTAPATTTSAAATTAAPVTTSLATTSAVTVAPTTSAAPGTTVNGDTTTLAPVPVTETVTLVVYDSFPTEKTPTNDALGVFTDQSGIAVKLVVAGDAGAMVSKAALTAGNPEGDVMWGVDNTLLSKALDAKVFDPYASLALPDIDSKLFALVPGIEVTPVDYGDVCVNADLGWYHDHGLTPPASLDDLIDPKYKDQLVVENPASSSPGLAFVLASVAKFGEAGWQKWWKALRANGVEVVDSWTSAYDEQFSGSAGKGPKPLVVSYGSSPPAEVIFADPPRTDAPTTALASTCFRQVEFAGVLRGTKHLAAAQQLVDFLASGVFQQTVALNLFVYPARTGVALPPEFTEFAVIPDSPFTLDPATIAANRDRWVDEWTQVVLR